MASQAEDELAPSQTDGFKVSEKKTIDEYTKLGEQSASIVVNPLSYSEPAMVWCC
jgi:Rho GDP-dissociation inhibitor